MEEGSLSNIKALLTDLIIIFLMGILSFGCRQEPKENTGNKSDQSQLSKEQYLEWFRDAKFGMFIHWGPYSRLAGEWNGRQVQVGRNAEWIMKELTIPVNEYRQLAHEMNPVRFNAKEWVRLAKVAGIKYIVITAKHHDGFAMYQSRVSSYNIVDWTPFKRDPLKELSLACHPEDLRSIGKLP